MKENEKLAREVLAVIGQSDLETGVSVLTNILGQIVAAISEGQLRLIDEASSNIAHNIKICAMNKLLVDDDKRREE